MPWRRIPALSINVIPPQWGRITQSGLFGEALPGITDKVEIVRENGKLSILSAEERGSRANVSDGELDDHVLVKVPHFPYDDLIKPEDIQGMIAATATSFAALGGAGREPVTLESEMTKRLAKIRRTHDITGEFLRMGALKGLILDGKGKTIYNLHTVFGITPKVVDFKLGTAGTDIRAKCEEIYSHIEDNIGDDVVGGVQVQVSPEFFAKLINHPKVTEFYLNAAQALELTGRNIREAFPLHGLIFSEYRASARGIDGQARRFIAANEGHAYPTGTMQTFEQYAAPPHHIGMVNRPATQEIFVSPKELDHGAGIELHTESNILAMCKRPEVLVKAHSSD
jgi:hypothetical protein